MHEYRSNQEARQLFEEERKKCSPLEKVREEHPRVAEAIDSYLKSEEFETANGGKSWEEIQKENEGRLQVIVRDDSLQPLESGKGKPKIRYIMRDSRDRDGVMDFLGTRSDLIVMIDHYKIDRVQFLIKGEVVHVTKGAFKAVDLRDPEGIKVTHPDGTVEVIRNAKIIQADEIGDVYM